MWRWLMTNDMFVKTGALQFGQVNIGEFFGSSVKRWFDHLARWKAEGFGAKGLEICGRGVMLLCDDCEAGEDIARHVAQALGLPFRVLRAECIAGNSEGWQRETESSAPCMIYLSPGHWLGGQSLEGYLRGTPAADVEVSDAQVFRASLRESMCTMATNGGQCIVVTSVGHISMMDTGLRRVGAFDRVIDVGAVKGPFLVHEMLAELGVDTLDPEMLERRDALGVLLRHEYADKRRRRLALNALRRVAWTEARAVGFRDLLAFMANGTADSEDDAVDDEVLWRTAVHEAGHAVVACLDPLSGVPSFASTLAGQHHMGVVLPSLAQMRECAVKGDVLIRDIKRQIYFSLAGRAAEQLLLPPDEVSATGAGGDLQRATDLVMEITYCKGVPLVAVSAEDWTDHLAVVDEDDLKRNDADLLAQTNVVLAAFYDDALGQLKANRRLLESVAQALHERRFLVADDFHKLMSQYRQASNSNVVFLGKE
jgi:hypothetical protein